MIYNKKILILTMSIPFSLGNIYSQNTKVNEEPKAFEHNHSYSEQLKAQESKSYIEKARIADEQARASQKKYDKQLNSLNKNEQARQKESNQDVTKTHLQKAKK